jgi:hypothetical protein
MRHYCTYFDHNYLPRGLVTLDSLLRHSPEAFVHVLCLSEACYEILSSLGLARVALLRLTELEQALPQLLEIKPTRDPIDYYFTLTPCLPWHLLQTVPGLDSITYLDADLWFASNSETIFQEAGDASVIITPHRFQEKDKHWEAYGIYNVSWLSFRADEAGLACLDWYKQSCLDWCHSRLEDGKYADQKYLDAFSKRFSGVHVIENRGVGLAPWNLEASTCQDLGRGLTVDGVPLIFYHAHGFRHLLGPFYDTGLAEHGARLQADLRKALFSPYARSYARQWARVAALLPADTRLQGIRAWQSRTAWRWFVRRILILAKLARQGLCVVAPRWPQSWYKRRNPNA